MEVMHLSAECYPVAKVGGLGDVVGALPKYLNQAGIEASVVMPYYDKPFVRESSFEPIYTSSASSGNLSFKYTVLKETTGKLGFTLYLIYIPGLLDRQEVYSYPDEIRQFIAFQISFLDWIMNSATKPDLIHCHDHHTGLVPFMASHSLQYNSLKTIPTVCTIHNAQYQGWLDWNKIAFLPPLNLNKAGLLDWNHCINSLAASVKCCWRYTTVSPNYLKELSFNSNGLEKLFEMEKAKGIGILNGIDTEVWNPAGDPMIFKSYTPETVEQGKKANKKMLCKQFGLSQTEPLVVFIGRLVQEKGADLLPDAITDCLKAYPDMVNFIVLGTGEPSVEQELQNLRSYGNCGVYIGYDETLAHLLYAGSDFLLMPSRVEPCGLNQLYALRYGTMPLVSITGGLKDTVIDLEEMDGYGICFSTAGKEEIIYAVGRAIDIFKNKNRMSELRKKMTGLDFSWDRSANEYIDLYKSLT